MLTDTQVSKTSPAIKRIIAATIGTDYPNIKVVVREVPASWEHTEYIDDKTLAWYVNLATGRAWQPEQPRYGGPAVVHPAPKIGEVLVHVWRSLGRKGMEIIVQEDAIDSATVSVVTDALLEHNKKLAAVTAKRCGVTEGLCLALAEANAKTIRKVEQRGDPTAASVSTSQTASAKRSKRSAAQLDREIAAVLGRR